MLFLELKKDVAMVILLGHKYLWIMSGFENFNHIAKARKGTISWCRPLSRLRTRVTSGVVTLYVPVCGGAADGTGGTANWQIVYFNYVVVKLFEGTVSRESIFESRIYFVKIIPKCIVKSLWQTLWNTRLTMPLPHLSLPLHRRVSTIVSLQDE